MRGGYRVVLFLLSVWFFYGCVPTVGTKQLPKKQDRVIKVWSDLQKEELKKLISTDPYLSSCGLKSSMVSDAATQKQLTDIFLKYLNNLSNSCIDIKSYKRAERRKKSKDIDTHFSIKTESILRSKIVKALKSRMSLDEIADAYKPTYEQFEMLVDAYRSLGDQNETDAKKLRKIRLNIERIKLLPKELGEEYALVNIPAFNVSFVKDGAEDLSFRVIVGKRNMQTPVFSSKMRYVMINPQWNVPDSIARKSIIPRYLRGGKGYLRAKGMEVRKSYDLNSPKVDPAKVDWSKYPKGKKGYIPYKFIQKPSLKNGLGRVKFIFPNHFAVYMHDTQSKSLFKRKVRAFSHGCIRLQKPYKLLKYITKNYTNKSFDEVKKRYDSKKSYMLPLSRVLPVHVVYLTAVAQDDGSVKLYNDIYGFDKMQKLNTSF